MPEEEKVVCETCGHDCHCDMTSEFGQTVWVRNANRTCDEICECETCQHD